LNLDWGVLEVDFCRHRGALVLVIRFEQVPEGRLSLVVVVRIVDLALMMNWYIEPVDRQSISDF
jgi:hypothetical protein